MEVSSISGSIFIEALQLFYIHFLPCIFRSINKCRKIRHLLYILKQDALVNDKKDKRYLLNLLFLYFLCTRKYRIPNYIIEISPI